MSEQGESFEQAVSELEQIVNEMEAGEISLEESLKKFERGIKLVRASQQQLASAEQKIKILMSNDESSPLQDFSDSISNE